MNCIVFAGPTIGHDEARDIFDATYLPPASQGDVYRATLEQPFAIGIIDGYFERVPAIWHKEILWAMDQGIHVFGSASMGALRAAELSSLGMEGVGDIFEQFQRGELQDDDEVTIVHASADMGYRAFSDAMVNIRATLSAAQSAGIISKRSMDAMVALAKATFYPHRSYARLLSDARAAGVTARDVAAFERWLPANRIDQKQRDARAMLARMAQLRDARPGPKRVRYQFQHTDAWEQVRRQIERRALSGEAGAETRQHDALLDELRLQPALYQRMAREALVRALALDLAAAQGADATPALITQVVDAFRRARGLHAPEQMTQWLDAQWLTVDDFSQLIEDEARLQQVLPVYEADLDRHLTDVLRLTGSYAALHARTQAKHEALARAGMANPTLAYADLTDEAFWRWLSVELLGRDAREVPADDAARDTLAATLGFKDADSLRRVALREYLYRRLATQSSDAPYSALP